MAGNSGLGSQPLRSILDTTVVHGESSRTDQAVQPVGSSP